MELSYAERSLEAAKTDDLGRGNGHYCEIAALLEGCAGTGKASADAAQRNRTRSAQEKLLREWVQSKGKLLDNDEFTRRVGLQGEDDPSGGEQDVYYDEGTGRWWKRNTLILHQMNGWHASFVDRLLLHNYLFPETAYRLEGYVEEGGLLMPVVSQPDVEATRGVGRQEAEAYMGSVGYRRGGGDNYWLGGLMVGDLHDENILIEAHSGQVAIIDPEITVGTMPEDGLP